VKHSKFEYVKQIVDAGINVLLTGEAGTGKTTIAMQVAEALNLPFSSYTMTKQTSVNALIGFNSINGTYIPSEFRKAYEDGHLFLLDEIDAADPNVLLVLNTLENGYIAFPDGIVKGHPNFRLMATANPQDQHNIYTGRSKLDFSTMDRYFIINLEHDHKLELTLTDEDTVASIELARKVFQENGSSKVVTMRDAIRTFKLSKANLDDNPIKSTVFMFEPTLWKVFESRYEIFKQERAEAKRKANMQQHEAVTIEELWNVINREVNDGNS